MTARETITCDDLEDAIARYASAGFRLDMIMPADDPREALMSVPSAVADGLSSYITMSDREKTIHLRLANANVRSEAGSDEWIAGRAGMMYRDLIPDRLGGKVIASHIRIVDGGDVADCVHYHKIGFQLIYCLKGAIRVVYEDQSDPFWLKPGDCVLQPPEIRHRVLEAEAGSEVIEITSPAEHETWFDHALTLPTNSVNRDRIFGTRRFGRHIDADSVWMPSGNDGIMVSETDIPGVQTLRDPSDRSVVSVQRIQKIALTLMIDGKGVEVSLPE